MKDLFYRIRITRQNNCRTECLGDSQTSGIRIYGIDFGRAHQSRSQRGTESNGALSKNGNCVTETNLSVLRRTEAGRGNIRQKNYILVAQIVGDKREIRLRKRYSEVLCLHA